MNKIVADFLGQIVLRYGVEICKDCRRLKSLLNDYCGEYRKEINVLIMTVNEGIVEDILRHESGKLEKLDINKLVQRLRDNTGLTEQYAKEGSINLVKCYWQRDRQREQAKR